MRRRARVRERADRDDDFAAACLKCAADDFEWWCNTFGWTYDPRLLADDKPAYVPFDLYPKQVELVEWVQQCRRDKANGAVPKSRGVGASWTLCAYSVWCWLFEPGVSITWGSRKEELVDKGGDPDSLFEKMRILLRRLPEWMLPPSFDVDHHSNHRRLVNPHTGATITGEQGRNMGRGGRSSVYFRDEAAHGDGLDEIERAVLENTDCLIDISTPNGIGNPFERKITKGSVRVHRMPWDSVPTRGEEWLAKKRRDYAHDPVGFAQEIMMDFAGSADRAVIPPRWVQAAQQIELEPGSTRSAGLDVAEHHDRNVYVDRRGPVAEHVESWTGTDTTQTTRRLVRLANEREALVVCYDPIGVGAGVSGELNNYEGTIGFAFTGVNVGDRPTSRRWPNGKKSDEQFANLKAELMWTLRERFRKTWERVEEGIEHPDDECIGLPADADELAAQVSWPQYERDNKGRIRIEKKSRTKKRLGTRESYDYLDALMLAFADDVVGRGGPIPMVF